MQEEKMEQLKNLVNQFNENGCIEMNHSEDLEVMKWAVSQAEKARQLEQNNKEITNKWIKTIIFSLELMDEHHPEWRFHAEKEIKQLKEILKK